MPRPAEARRWPAFVALVAFALFAGLTALVQLGLTASFDRTVTLDIYRHASPTLDSLFIAASLLARGDCAVPLALLGAWLMWRRGWGHDALLWIMAWLGGSALQNVLKWAIERPRPKGLVLKLTDAGWYAYPSGHTMLSMTVFGFGAALLAREATTHTARIGWLALGAAIVITVSFSRIYLGAHWPTDTLGAMLASVGWAATCIALVDRRRNTVAPPASPDTP